MAELYEVNERSTSILTVYFWDQDGTAVTPDSATYRIDDIGTGTAILASTNITGLSTSVSLHITYAQNRILTETNQFEYRRVTVVFLYDTSSKQGTNSYDYRIKNMSGVTTT